MLIKKQAGFEGQPDAVLTHLWGSSVGISQRSNDPRQRWELK